MRQPVDSCLLRWAFHCNRLGAAFLNRVSTRSEGIVFVSHVHTLVTDPYLRGVRGALCGLKHDVKLCVPTKRDYEFVLSEYYKLLVGLHCDFIQMLGESASIRVFEFWCRGCGQSAGDAWHGAHCGARSVSVFRSCEKEYLDRGFLLKLPSFLFFIPRIREVRKGKCGFASSAALPQAYAAGFTIWNVFSWSLFEKLRQMAAAANIVSASWRPLGFCNPVVFRKSGFDDPDIRESELEEDDLLWPMDAFPEPPGVDIEYDPMEFADHDGAGDFDDEVFRLYRWLLFQ